MPPTFIKILLLKKSICSLCPRPRPSGKSGTEHYAYVPSAYWYLERNNMKTLDRIFVVVLKIGTKVSCVVVTYCCIDKPEEAYKQLQLDLFLVTRFEESFYIPTCFSRPLIVIELFHQAWFIYHRQKSQNGGVGINWIQAL